MMLAEISDKMPTIAEGWLHMLLLALPVFVIGLLLQTRHLYIGWILAGFQCLIIAFFMIGQAFFESSFSEVVREELGGIWVANSVLSSTSPLFLMAAAHWLHKKWPDVWEIKDPSDLEQSHPKPLHMWR